MNLSKSQYMKGLQCPKALWLFKNRKELATEADQRRQNLFTTGHRVGDLAKRLFPGGAQKKIYATRDEARGEIFNFIEMFYNPVKRHSHTGGVSPAKFEADYFSRLEGV